MAVFDTGNFMEGTGNSVIPFYSAFNFAESPAHNRGKVPIFPIILFSISVGSSDGSVPAGPFYPYPGVPSGDTWADTLNATTATPPDTSAFFSFGKELFAMYPVSAGNQGIAIVGIDGGSGVFGSFANIISKMLIFGPISGIVTTNLYSQLTSTLGSPITTTTLTLATVLDSMEFVCPTTAAPDVILAVFWPNITAGMLPTFPLLSSDTTEFGFPFFYPSDL